MSDAWEYAVMNRVYNGFEWRTGGGGVKLWKNRNLPMALDRAGTDGWELVGFDTRKEATTYVFKRRAPAPCGGHDFDKDSVAAPDSGTGSASVCGGGDEDDRASQAAVEKAGRTEQAQTGEQALANVLMELLPVLDDIGRARDNAELTGGFKSVAESLKAIAVRLGLTSYGEIGEPFDPMLHEALMYSHSADVSEPTCVQILQPGYKVGDRIIRPARVAVAGPDDDVAAADVGV